MVAAIKINTKGNAIDIEPDCMACKAVEPPPTNRATATNPITIAHITLCILGVFSLPPDVILLITNEPESADVTKNNTNMNKENMLVKIGNQRLSNI